MAFLSQDLFEVFEEKTEPVSLTGKKRKRAEEKGDKESADGQKKVKAAAAAATTVGGAGSSSSSQTEVVDLTGDDEGSADPVEEMA